MHILAFAANDWDGPWMNRQQILSRLGVNHRIVYSNGLWNIWQRHEASFKKAPISGDFTTMDNVLVDIPPKHLLRHPKSQLLDKIVIKLGGLRWKRKLNQDFSAPLLVYVFHPSFWPLVEPLKPDFVIYHAYDLFRLTPGWNESLDSQERLLLQRANYVFGSSRKIVNDLSEKADREVIFLPNGVDYDIFNCAENKNGTEPEDLSGIPRPRIGYAGNINRKVDLPLITELAQRNRSWQFVIVGGVANLDEVTGNSLETLRQLSNIHLLGEKKSKELPKYINNMDINLMSYRTSDKLWTQAIYPLKLHEYLAGGKPVVSADIPAVREFSHVIQIVNNKTEHWEEAITSGLKDNDKSMQLERLKVARQNSWSERVKILDQYIDALQK